MQTIATDLRELDYRASILFGKSAAKAQWFEEVSRYITLGFEVGFIERILSSSNTLELVTDLLRTYPRLLLQAQNEGDYDFIYEVMDNIQSH